MTASGGVPVGEFLLHSESTDRTVSRIFAKLLQIDRNRGDVKPLLHVINSTGTGKTRTMIHLTKKTPSIYLSCPVQGREGDTTHDVQLLLAVFEECGQSHAARAAVAVVFLREMEALLQENDAEKLHGAQFRGGLHIGLRALKSAESLLERLRSAKALALSTESKRRVRFVLPDALDGVAQQLFGNDGITDANSDCCSESDSDIDGATARMGVMTLDKNDSCGGDGASGGGSSDGVDCAERNFAQCEKRSDTESPLLVIFDEADGLLAGLGVEDPLCPLRCIQRALCSRESNPHNLIGVFLCTSSRLDSLENRIPSERACKDTRSREIPFIELVHLDLHQHHVFLLGRPLWQSRFTVFKRKYETLLNFAETKLLYGSHNATLSRTACSLFMLRFGFEPIAGECQEFVANHLALMTHIDRDDKGVPIATSTYLSEPILAEAAARLMNGFGHNNHYLTAKVVAEVKKSIISNQLVQPSVGDRGEVVAFALLGLTLDVLKGEEIAQNSSRMGTYQKDKRQMYQAGDPRLNMSNKVCLSNFLRAVGVNSTSIPSVADQYYVNFTHAVRLETEVTLSHCYQAVFRRLAFYVSAGAQSVDLVVIAWKGATQDKGHLMFCPIRVQVKCLKKTMSVQSSNILLHNMSPMQKCQPYLKDTELEVGIIMVVGTGGTQLKSSADAQVLPVQSHAHDTRGKSTTTFDSPSYYGYLIDASNKLFLPTLRNAPEGEAAIENLLEIAQYHAKSVQDTDECFAEGFNSHHEAMNDISLRTQLIAGL